MKINHLINEIVRGMWMMDPQAIDSYMPFVHNLLRGNLTAPAEAAEKPAIVMLNGNGQKTLAADGTPEKKTAFVSMIGAVTKYGGWCTPGAMDIVDMLTRANNDEAVDSIVLYIDGPGGSVSAINPFVEFGKVKKKPVVVLADNALSLHYFSAVSVADHIMGENPISGRFGSIGVESRFADDQKYWEEKGYKFHTIRPPESSEKNKLYDEMLEGKYEGIIATSLSPMAQKFQNAVKEARPQLEDRDGVLSGATFGTEEALEIGLIDSIGNFQKAVALAKALVEVGTI